MKDFSFEPHFMINDGLSELAANAVEMVVDQRTCLVYAVYLSSDCAYGESNRLVKIAKFNILQPAHVQWGEVFHKDKDFESRPLSECNVAELDGETVRVYAVDYPDQIYYYKDVDKKTLLPGALRRVKYEASTGTRTDMTLENVNRDLAALGEKPFHAIQCTSPIVRKGGSCYTTLCGGDDAEGFLFIQSSDCETWRFCSFVRHRVNYEAMLAVHDGRFWVMCRNGSEEETREQYCNLMYSDDGIHWAQSNLALTVSDTRPYLFTFGGDLCLAYSSPLPRDYSTVRPWRCNLHVGRIVSENRRETFEEMIYKESKFGIVYFALHDWNGKLILLYSSGELHPTEALMYGWSQGKDMLSWSLLNR